MKNKKKEESWNLRVEKEGRKKEEIEKQLRRGRKSIFFRGEGRGEEERREKKYDEREHMKELEKIFWPDTANDADKLVIAK